MLVHWRTRKTPLAFTRLKQPELDRTSQDLRSDNKGINNSKIIDMAKRLGLAVIPPITPTTDAVESWLKRYGPLWVNGRKHIVVIAGIKKAASGDHQVLVYDPAPRNVGQIEWRSWRDWYEFGSSKSTRDTSKWVKSTFLHCP